MLFVDVQLKTASSILFRDRAFSSEKFHICKHYQCSQAFSATSMMHSLSIYCVCEILSSRLLCLVTFLDETEEVVGNYDDESDAEHAFHSSEARPTDSHFPPSISKLPQLDSPSKNSQGSLTLPPIQSITSFTPPTPLNN